jgi:hypothetical protein
VHVHRASAGVGPSPTALERVRWCNHQHTREPAKLSTLAVSVRSFRAEKLSEFVGALIAGEMDAARSLYALIKQTYPIVLTRDLAQAKAWLRSRAARQSNATPTLYTGLVSECKIRPLTSPTCGEYSC